jgi:hypothetical protein
MLASVIDSSYAHLEKKIPGKVSIYLRNRTSEILRYIQLCGIAFQPYLQINEPLVKFTQTSNHAVLVPNDITWATLSTSSFVISFPRGFCFPRVARQWWSRSTCCPPLSTCNQNVKLKLPRGQGRLWFTFNSKALMSVGR